jgi:hypothetical protein
VIAIAAVLVMGLLGAGPAGAFPEPIGSTWKCAYKNAGYVGFGTRYDPKYGSVEARIWDGSLQWQMCVVRKSNGYGYAEVQLSAPVTMNTYDRFTGVVYVYLEACFAGGRTVEMIAQGYRGVSQYDVGSKVGSRYYFPAVSTSQTTGAASCGYRVHIQTWQAFVVPRSLGQFIALSSDDVFEGATFYTGWMSL